ncbi:MAG: hypothetical protein WC836_20540 [Desulfobacula sp.]
MIDSIISFFTHPFFSVVGGISSILVIFGFFYTGFIIFKGVLPLWIRLGRGLANRKIAIFAEDEFNDLRSLLVDSKIFKDKNIVQITKKNIKKAEEYTLMLVHWKCFESEIDEILAIKKDTDALIVYAPQDEGFLNKLDLNKINSARNTILVNFRGRLLNDVTLSMITTAFKA